MLNKNQRLDNLENELEQQKTSIDLMKYMLINQYLDSNKNFCPICGNISEFRSFGNPERKNVRCNYCESVERHRLVWLFFQQRFESQFKNKKTTLLHFAPELSFYDYFRTHENIDYYPVDFNPKIFESRNIHIRKKVDMQDIPFPDDKFDVIYACHILEHIPDDIKAMSELYRVLKNGGSCIILVPLKRSLKETLEKKEYNTPELRKKYYGQEDHLRYYSMDIQDRLESVGFKVQALTGKHIVKSDIERKFYRVLEKTTIFLCKKEL